MIIAENAALAKLVDPAERRDAEHALESGIEPTITVASVIALRCAKTITSANTALQWPIFERLLSLQDECCAICGRHWTDCAAAKRTRYERIFLQHLYVDQDHDTEPYVASYVTTATPLLHCSMRMLPGCRSPKPICDGTKIARRHKTQKVAGGLLTQSPRAWKRQR